MERRGVAGLPRAGMRGGGLRERGGGFGRGFGDGTAASARIRGRDGDCRPRESEWVHTARPPCQDLIPPLDDWDQAMMDARFVEDDVIPARMAMELQHPKEIAYKFLNQSLRFAINEPRSLRARWTRLPPNVLRMISREVRLQLSNKGAVESAKVAIDALLDKEEQELVEMGTKINDFLLKEFNELLTGRRSMLGPDNRTSTQAAVDDQSRKLPPADALESSPVTPTDQGPIHASDSILVNKLGHLGARLEKLRSRMSEPEESDSTPMSQLACLIEININTNKEANDAVWGGSFSVGSKEERVSVSGYWIEEMSNQDRAVAVPLPPQEFTISLERKATYEAFEAKFKQNPGPLLLIHPSYSAKGNASSVFRGMITKLQGTSRVAVGSYHVNGQEHRIWLLAPSEFAMNRMGIPLKYVCMQNVVFGHLQALARREP